MRLSYGHSVSQKTQDRSRAFPEGKVSTSRTSAASLMMCSAMSALQCVWLDQSHPLKVLAAMQLVVLERESQGLLPRQRRGRQSGLPMIRPHPYQSNCSMSQGDIIGARSPPPLLPSVAGSHDVFKAPSASYSSSPENSNVKFTPFHAYKSASKLLHSSSVHTSPSSSLSGVSSFDASPQLRRLLVTNADSKSN